MIIELLPLELSALFKVYRQVLFWFDFKDQTYFDPWKFPVFIMHLPNNKDAIYGFPAVKGKQHGVKIATHNVLASTEQKELNRDVDEDEIHTFYQTYIQDNFGDIISPHCLKTSVCSYTLTPDENFVVDYIPNNQHSLFISACSGHGFKHSAAIGEIGVDILFQRQMILEPNIFSYKRFKLLLY